MRLYGEANNVPGLASGPIETRFARLRKNADADTFVLWTTPERWAAGEGLSLRFPQLHLEFACTLADGHLSAVKALQVPEDARPPDREPGAVGVSVDAERIALPPEGAAFAGADPGVALLEAHFARLAGRRWGGFVEPLRAALDAEAADDEARSQRLTVPFKEAALVHGGDEDIWRLKGLPAEALRALDDGEWIEVLDEQGRSRTSARVVDTHTGQATLMVGVRTAADPPRAGFIRPRSRRKILEQKRALLDELANPTGSLPHLVRLVATPSAMPAPRPVRPTQFVNTAVLRNRSQSRAVALALGLDEGEALCILGPPGTGKSTTAAEIDVQLIARDPGVRILVCSHSNHGTDNMLMKVLPFLEDAEERIARIGFYERIAKEARPYYAPPDADLGDKNIIFTTIDALILQDVAGARVYDYVILDEANRAGVLDSLLALARGKRMIMVGDPMQLQPVMSEAEQSLVARANGRHGRNGHAVQPQPGGSNVIGKSLFAWLQERHFSPSATVLLDQQNRMHPSIGELVSRVFYGSRVRTGPAAPRRGTGMAALPSPVTWVDTRSLRGNAESRAGGTSLFNLAEARLVTSITRHLASHAPPNLTIGVITAYAEQREVLRRLMGPHDWPPERQLEIDTVDAFEGREKDIIVLSLVRANRRRDVGFLRLEQRLNVAVSRSRRLLVVVGDTSTLRGGYFNHLVATASSVGAIVPAARLLSQLTQRVRRPKRDRQREGVAEPTTGEQVAGSPDRPETPVAPTGAPQQEGGVLPPGGSRRRRRRRAWERLRERRAAEVESAPPADQADAETPPPSDAISLGDGGAEVVAPGPSEVPEAPPAPRRRLPRRRLASGAPANGAVGQLPAAEPVQEQEPMVVPPVAETGATEAPSLAGAAEAGAALGSELRPEMELDPDPDQTPAAPKRRATRRPRAAAIEATAEPAPPKKPRATRRKVAPEGAEVSALVPEVTPDAEPKPKPPKPRASRRKTGAEPTSNQPSAVSSELTADS